MCRYLDIIPLRWVEEQYRICADVSEGWGEDGAGGGLNVVCLNEANPPPNPNSTPLTLTSTLMPTPMLTLTRCGRRLERLLSQGAMVPATLRQHPPPRNTGGRILPLPGTLLVITPPSRALPPRGVEVNVRAAAQHQYRIRAIP